MGGPGEPLDPLIHTQARLRIMTTLTALPPGDRLTFPRLQALLDATAGNLSTHLRRLEEAGYVLVTKSHVGRVPATHVEVTRAGRRAFEDYLAQLSALLTPPAGATPAVLGSSLPGGSVGPTTSSASAGVPDLAAAHSTPEESR